MVGRIRGPRNSVLCENVESTLLSRPIVSGCALIFIRSTVLSTVNVPTPVSMGSLDISVTRIRPDNVVDRTVERAAIGGAAFPSSLAKYTQ